MKDTIYYYGALPVKVHPDDAEGLINQNLQACVPLDFFTVDSIDEVNAVRDWLASDQPEYTREKRVCPLNQHC